MGCCTYFRKTWWPGYNSDVIDPNKAFDCDRWIERIRRMIITVLVLALLIGSIFLVWRYISTVLCNTTDSSPLETLNVNSSSTSSTTNGSSSLPQQEDHPKAELHKGSIFNADSFLKSTTPFASHPNATTTTKTGEEPHPVKENHEMLLNENIGVANLTSTNLTASSEEASSASTNSTDQLEDIIELDPAYAVGYGNLTETSTSSSTSSTSESPLSSSSSTTTTHVPASSGEWCASKENTMECVALTKNFRILTTFHTGSVKHNESAEGYIMVKLKNSTWHPYCYPHWTLEMGYKLCHSLGFRRLIQLQTIDISQLQKRISQKFGREKVPVPVMRADNFSEQAARKDMLVLTGSSESTGTGGGSSVLKTVSSQQFSCEAGFISCLN